MVIPSALRAPRPHVSGMPALVLHQARLDDPYRALARVYDAWQARYGSFADRALDKLLDTLVGQEVRSLVDLGCGTGALLVSLSARRPDWRLCGVDASPAMVQAAEAKSTASPVLWRTGRLGEPIPGRPYDAAGCFFNTLNHVTDPVELTRAFQTAAGALADGGWFLFDTNNDVGYRAWWTRPQRFAGPGWSLEVTPRYDPAAGRARATVRVVCGDEATCTVVEQRRHGDAEIGAALRGAGLTLLAREAWRPFPHDPPGATFWVARRLTAPSGGLRRVRRLRSV